MKFVVILLLVAGAEARSQVESTTSPESISGRSSSAQPPSNLAPAEPVQKIEQRPTVEPAPAVVPKPEKVGKISQIFRDKKQAIITLDPSLTDLNSIPAKVVIALPNGEACEGTVLQSQDRQSLIDVSECSILDQVKSGALVTPQPFATATTNPKPTPEPVAEPKATPAADTPPPVSKPHRPIKFFFGAGVHTGTEMKFTDMSITDGTTTSTGTYTLEMDSASRLLIGLAWLPEYHWGLTGSISLETERELKKESYEMDDGSTLSVALTGKKPTVRFALIEANVAYRWDAVYLPFGLNVSTISLDLPSSTLILVDSTGAIGAQGGVGFLIGKNFYAEILTQIIGATLKYTAGNIVQDNETGYMPGFLLRSGFIF